MKKYLSQIMIVLMVIVSGIACAGGEDSGKSEKTEDQNRAATPQVVSVTTDDEYDFVKENIEMAIADLGLIVSGTLHISDMLNRTGKDLGFDKPVFKKAEAIEFCSAKVSHQMAALHPGNVTVCPFTIAIYELTDKPNEIQISYHKVALEGDGEKLEQEIHAMLQGIVDEAL